MIEWYKDKNLLIEFSDKPQVAMRYVLPSTPKEEKERIEKRPFINKRNLGVHIVDKDGFHYNFTIPKDYCWDGASIPRMFWRLIGAKTDSRFLIPSLIHDVLCENHEYVEENRYLADKVFERLLYVSGVSPLNRWLMFHSVDNYQKFCHWGES